MQVNKLLALILLIPVIAFADYEQHEMYSKGNSIIGSLLPDWIGVFFVFLYGCFLIIAIIYLPFGMHKEKVEEEKINKNTDKVKSKLLEIGIPKNKITREEAQKYETWLRFIEGNKHYKKQEDYKYRAKKEGVDLKNIKKLLKICDASQYGKIIWKD